VALRCIPNLLPGSPVDAVAVEWTTDYVLLGRDGHAELVSVKHRDPGQHDWTFGRLKAEKVFQDLHAVWRAMGEKGDYVFESNKGFDRSLSAYLGSPRETHMTDEAALDRLADVLEVDREETHRFINHFFLRRDPLPDRWHINAVAVQDLAVVMERLNLDPRRARACFAALATRIAEASTQRPPAPADRVDRLVGFLRNIEGGAVPRLADQTLSMTELRRIVKEACTDVAARSSVGSSVIEDPLFIGRERELSEIKQLLVPGSEDPVAPVVLHGLTGIGKTALAMAFAAAHNTVLQTFILPAETRATLLASIGAINPVLEPITTFSSTPEKTRGATSDPKIPDDCAILIIIDGVTDPQVVEGVVKRKSKTRILITATCRHVDDAFHHLELKGLSLSDGTSYLAQILPQAGPDELRELFDEFHGHALGLVQSANYCRSEGLGPHAYLDRLRKWPGRALELGRAPSHPQPVGSAIAAAITAASQYDRAAEALIRIMAWYAPEPLPETIFSRSSLILERDDEQRSFLHIERERLITGVANAIRPLQDPLALDGAVAALHRFGLVRRDIAGLNIHVLVRTMARERIPPEQRASWIEVALGFLLPCISGDGDNIDTVVLLPHVAACVEAAEAAETTEIDPLAIGTVLSWLGNQHYRLGAFIVAQEYFEKALSIARHENLPVNVQMGCFENLSLAYSMRGLIDEALQVINEWLATSERIGDKRSLYVARRMRIEALSYAARYSEAMDEFSTFIRGAADFPRTASDRIMEWTMLAEMENARGNFDAALTALDSALALTPEVEPEDLRRSHLAILHNKAAGNLSSLGQASTALERQRQAVETARQVGGLALPIALYALASRLLDLDIADEAERIIAEGIELVSQGDIDSPLYGSFLQAGARVALFRKEYRKAKVLLSEAIPLLEAGGDPQRGEVASAYFNLSTALKGIKRFAEAADAAQYARDVDASIYGPDHPELLRDECALAESLFLCKRFRDADLTIKRCLAFIKRGAPESAEWRARAIGLSTAIDLQLGRERAE
jgi:tetratricopeptide (TPR) repeat protein